MKCIYIYIMYPRIPSAQLNEFLQTEFFCVTRIRSRDRTLLVTENPQPWALSRYSLTANRRRCFYLVWYFIGMEPYSMYSFVSDFSWLHAFVIYLHHYMYYRLFILMATYYPICEDLTTYFPILDSYTYPVPLIYPFNSL